MRNYLQKCGDPGLQLMSGGDFSQPLTQLDFTGVSAELRAVLALPTESGEPQAATGRGGCGTLKRAGRP